MNLYIVDYEAPSTTGPQRAWCASRAEAESCAEELRDKYAAHRVGKPERVSIPTDAAGLATWLNIHAPHG